MITGIGHVEMTVRDIAACSEVYGKELGFEELARGEGADGGQIAMFVCGTSVLELRENPDAVNGFLPSGEKKDPMDVPGSVGHFAFYAEDNDEAFVVLKDVLLSKTRATKDGPAVQPVDHAYMQRSLLEFDDPNGYVVQIADVLDPREHLKDRRAEKTALAAAAGGAGLLRGFDHLHIGCTDVALNRQVFGRQLGLAEVSHRMGEGDMPEGSEEAIFAAGLADLEISQNPAAAGRRYGAGTVTSMGFWTDDVDQAYGTMQDRGASVGGPPAQIAALPGVSRRAFTFEGLNGLRLEIAQRG